MSAPFFFEHRYKDRLWRLQPLEYRGKPRLHLWAWFARDGGWRPCKGDAVGFVLSSREDIEALRDGLNTYLSSEQ